MTSVIVRYERVADSAVCDVFVKAYPAGSLLLLRAALALFFYRRFALSHFFTGGWFMVLFCWLSVLLFHLLKFLQRYVFCSK